MNFRKGVGAMYYRLVHIKRKGEIRGEEKRGVKNPCSIGGGALFRPEGEICIKKM